METKLMTEPTSAADGTPAAPETLLRQEEAAQILGLTPRALEAWRHRGGGPTFIKISGRCIRYRQSDLLKWIAERERTSTSQE